MKVIIAVFVRTTKNLAPIMEGSKPKLIHAETENIDRWQREDTNAITPPETYLKPAPQQVSNNLN